MSFGYLIDYEPDYDAVWWDEYIQQDEEWLFYATHERILTGTDTSANAQNGREMLTNTTDNATMRAEQKADDSGK